MRTLALLIALAAAGASQYAHGRAFWQTYGATVPSPTGGCAWNLNSDYFVPRYCDSCRYGLFSPCKTSHSVSPACRNLHPVYSGYCTPFGSWHYKRHDHVYAKKCGCTPLACVYGPWELEKCRKHGCRRLPALDSGCESCGGPPIGFGQSFDASALATRQWHTVAVTRELPNVEPLGGEVLGVIQAYPARMGGASMGGMGMPGMTPGAMPMPMPTAAPTPTGTPAGNALMMPNLFGS